MLASGRVRTTGPAGSAREMVISLIGGRGSGKTTVGGTLADRLGWEFIDADAEVVRRDGRDIPQIFAEDGEPAFRKAEEAAIAALLDRTDDAVLATGGGAVLSADTRRRLRAAGPVVWLTADAETLAARVAADATERPSLTGRPAAEEMAEVLAARTPLYQQTATVTEPVGDRTVEEIVASIVARVLPAGGRP